MKVRFIGETFYNGLGLTNNKVYECVEIDREMGALGIIDDEGEKYMYSIKSPCAPDGSSSKGKWEIIEDPTGELKVIFEEYK